MKPKATPQTSDPCLPIQADLSAMLDGELDAAVVRRVMVHSDACPKCSAFLNGIRNQARAQRTLAACGILDSQVLADDAAREARGEPFADAALGSRDGRVSADELRQRLLENQRQLAKILYELGRGYVLLGVNPSFSRVVAREPVPVPDMCLRGRNLLDEVERLSSREKIHIGQEWVRAKVLLSQRDVRDPVNNLAKGKRLLHEALALWPGYHEARIYLGHAYQVECRFSRAIDEFTRVLAESRNPVIRAFALENLGNLHLEQGRCEQAVELFVELVDSGIIAREPRFHTSYFNLALACGFLERFEDCEYWLGLLDAQFPHRRRALAAEFAKRSQFAAVVRRNEAWYLRFSARFPAWFPDLADMADMAAGGAY